MLKIAIKLRIKAKRRIMEPRYWCYLFLWLFGIIGSGIHRGLQASYGPNIIDGYRRQCLRRAEIILMTEQPDIEYSVWWPPRDMPTPELADYPALKRAVCSEYARITNTPDLPGHSLDLRWAGSAAAIANRDWKSLRSLPGVQGFPLSPQRRGLPFLPGSIVPRH